MAIKFDPTRTWSKDTPNDGELLNSEFERIYYNFSQLKLSGTRHCILDAKKDADGYSNFLSELNDQISIDTTGGLDPCFLTWADGFIEIGENNYVKKIDSDVAPAEWNFSGASDNTYFLYVDNDGNGNLSYGYTVHEPQYGYSKGIPGTVDKNYFVIPEMKMYTDTGTEWSSIIRLFVGEIFKSSGEYSLVSYAIRGEFISQEQGVPSGATVTVPHNIGTILIKGRVMMICKTVSATAQHGYSIGEITNQGHESPMDVDDPVYPIDSYYISDRNTIGHSTPSYLTMIANKSTGAYTGAINNVDWKYLFFVKRDF